MRAGSKHVVSGFSRTVQLSRRAFLQTGVASVLALESTSWIGASTMEQSRSSGTPSHPELKSVKALVFDVFGTVVDWRSSVAREVDALARKKSLKVDGAAFADAWRAQYAPMMDRVRTGKLPWTKLDRLHRMILDDIVGQFGFGGLTEAERSALNLAWHRLQPWPDAVPGLTRLKKRFILAPLSNGNISLMTDLARHAGLPWDCILGAELARHYKPDREVYQSAADFLDLAPDQIVMVAAHQGDLRAARGVGLKTAFVPRPLEFGPGGRPDLTPDPSFDIVATDFNDLAQQLGA
jgi:2-haloacid dehalogenase